MFPTICTLFTRFCFYVRVIVVMTYWAGEILERSVWLEWMTPENEKTCPFFSAKSEITEISCKRHVIAKSTHIFWTDTSFGTWWYMWYVQFIVWWSLFYHENANINTINIKVTSMLCAVSVTSIEGLLLIAEILRWTYNMLWYMSVLKTSSLRGTISASSFTANTNLRDSQRFCMCNA